MGVIGILKQATASEVKSAKLTRNCKLYDLNNPNPAEIH
jgi:hypothetical protein